MGELTILKIEFLTIKQQIHGWNAAHFADLHCIVFTGHGYLKLHGTKATKKFTGKNVSYTIKEVEHILLQPQYLGCGIAGFG